MKVTFSQVCKTNCIFVPDQHYLLWNKKMKMISKQKKEPKIFLEVVNKVILYNLAKNDMIIWFYLKNVLKVFIV